MHKNRLVGRFLMVCHSIADPRDMVGATGFEPATFSSRTRRATKLRYAPKMARILQKSFVAQDVTPDFSHAVLAR